MTKYFKWFDVASKSRNLNNTEKDFSQYNNDDIMAEVIKRIKKDKLTTDEHKFVSDLPLYEAYYSTMQLEAEEKVRQTEEEAEKRVQLVEKKVQVEQQKRLEEHQKLLKGIENLLRRGDTVASIADLLVRSAEEIAGFVAEIEAKKG